MSLQEKVIIALKRMIELLNNDYYEFYKRRFKWSGYISSNQMHLDVQFELCESLKMCFPNEGWDFELSQGAGKNDKYDYFNKLGEKFELKCASQKGKDKCVEWRNGQTNLDKNFEFDCLFIYDGIEETKYKINGSWFGKTSFNKWSIDKVKDVTNRYAIRRKGVSNHCEQIM
jgi:hypothetical protein